MYIEENNVLIRRRLANSIFFVMTIQIDGICLYCRGGVCMMENVLYSGHYIGCIPPKNTDIYTRINKFFVISGVYQFDILEKRESNGVVYDVVDFTYKHIDKVGAVTIIQFMFQCDSL